MSLGERVADDHQLARLLQIGIVLEEMVEARAARHHESLDAGEKRAGGEAGLAAEVVELLEHAAEESAAHRRRLESLVEDLQADSVPYEEIEELVGAQYAPPGDFDGVLYDQLHGEETAYKFYDDLIEAIEESDATFGVDRQRLLATLREIRADEEAGVREVTELMEAGE